jgi:hypothetical protein
MKNVCTVCFLLILMAAMAISCGTSPKAPTTPDGQPTTIVVLFDRGLEDKTEDQINQLNQLSDFMETDLINRLKNTGYNAELGYKDEPAAPTPGKYVMTVKLVKYNPGSKAARMMVGMGAGTCTLDLHYELQGEAAEPLISKDHGRASSDDWDNIARRLNKEMVEDITIKLNSK